MAQAPEPLPVVNHLPVTAPTIISRQPAEGFVERYVSLPAGGFVRMWVRMDNDPLQTDSIEKSEKNLALTPYDPFAHVRALR